MKQQALLLYFVKYPEPGRVKTRLGHSIGMREAARFYRLSARELWGRLHALPARLVCCGAPEAEEREYRAWLETSAPFFHQIGANLGDRMGNALRCALEWDRSPALLIGSDLPDLPMDFLLQALEALDAGRAVIGPGMDGGFYAVGLPATPFPEQNPFEAVSWSSGQEQEQTVSGLRRLGFEVQMLAPWRDIDTLDDLAAFAARARPPLTPGCRLAWDILGRLPRSAGAPTRRFATDELEEA